MNSNAMPLVPSGGTELMLGRLQRTLDPDLLSQIEIIPSGNLEHAPTGKSVLWIHNTPYLEPEILQDAAYRKRFSKIVMVSDWQMHMFNGVRDIPFSECEIIRNGIEPIETRIKQNPRERVNLIYHPVPNRGLQVLAPAFERVSKIYPNVHLDVYSSFAAYGRPEWDTHFTSTIEWCQSHPKVTYHGYQSNEVVRRALQASHIFAYPSIWMETSCIAAIEAMSAGNLVVAPNYGALIDTCNRWAFGYQWTENFDEHVSRFADALSNTIARLLDEPERSAARIASQKAYVDEFYDWKVLSAQWDGLLRRILAA